MRVPFNIALLVPIICISAAADRVSVKDGRIVLEDSAGHMTMLTQTGLDSDPWLSPDGRSLVFLRHSAEDMFRTAVYEMDMRGRTVRLLYGGPARYRGRETSYFGQPELDGSHDTLFLLSKEYATEGALIAIRLANGQVRLISDHVVGYDVIACAKDRGNLIALKRQEDVLGNPYHLYWLYSPSGKELGLAGAEELDVDALRHDDCDAAQPLAPLPSRPISPPSRGAVRMDQIEMEHRLITHVEPTYPKQAQSEHIQGDVRLQVQVAADGTVRDVSLVSGPPQLVAAAITAVKQWRYLPAISSGHAVPVVAIVNVPFRLPVTDK